MKTENLYKIVPVVFSVFVLCFAVAFYALGWTEPTAVPPNNNVDPPINEGSDSQVKSGALGVSGVFKTFSMAMLEGDVGIGIFNRESKIPQSKLHIIQPDSTGISWAAQLHNTYAAKEMGGTGVGLKLKTYQYWDTNHLNKWTGIASESQSDLTYGKRVDQVFYTVENADVAAPTEKMRITGPGNVGIGLKNPDHKLMIISDSTGTGDRTMALKALENRTVNAANNSPGIEFIPAENDLRGSVGLAGFESAWSSGSRPGDMVVATSSDRYLIFGTENTAVDPFVTTKMIITDDGKVGIGLGESGGAAVLPTYRLELPNTASADGRGRANQWVTYSSRRWKENIESLDSEEAIGKIMNLNPVSFSWKEEHGGKKDVGFIAEEVGKVIPEAVEWEENGEDADSLSTDQIISYLVKVVQQQEERIKELEAKIEK